MRRVLAVAAPSTHGPKALSRWDTPRFVATVSTPPPVGSRAERITGSSFWMPQTPPTRCGGDRMSAEGRSRAVAAVIVVLIHGAVTWVLVRPPGWLVGKSPLSPVLRVRWIEHARPAVPTSPPDARATPAPSADPSVPSPDPDRVARSLDATQRPPDVAISASTPDYVAQGAAWAAESAPATDFQPGLMASRVPRLPGGASGGRFHMREPPSPHRTLQAIGRMLAGPDYTTDPCPRMHDNVHGLLTDTSDEGRRRLAWELLEYRDRCRP